MQRVKSFPRVSKRATELSVTARDASTCSDMEITWDASQGEGPWTVMVATINQQPSTFSVSSASGSDFTIAWPVPRYPDRTAAIVGVVDASGEYAGVSRFATLTPESGARCSSPPTTQDFVWYPTDDDEPEQCSIWGLTYQADDENHGIRGDVSFTFLAENALPFTVDARSPSGRTGELEWGIPFPAGTRMAVIGNDDGQTGTGGVGDLYTVGSGGSTACSVQNANVALPPAAESLAATSSSSASSTSTSSGSRATSAGAGAATSAQAQPTFGSGQDAGAQESGNSNGKAGTAVGATIGVLGALAIIGVLIFCLRRKRKRDFNEKGGDPYGVGANTITPWRYSGAPFAEPQTNSRTARWLQRRSQGGAAAFGAAGAGHDDWGYDAAQDPFASGPYSSAHGHDEILRAKPHNREDFALSTIASSGIIDQDARSSMPSFRSPHASQIPQPYPATVPDASLFPPPPGSQGHMRGYGAAGFGSIPAGYYDDGQSPYSAHQGQGRDFQQGPQEFMSPSSSASSGVNGGRIPRKQVPAADAAFAQPPMGSSGDAYAPAVPRKAPLPPSGPPQLPPSSVTSEVLMLDSPAYRGRIDSSRRPGVAGNDDDDAPLPYL